MQVPVAPDLIRDLGPILAKVMKVCRVPKADLADLREHLTVHWYLNGSTIQSACLNPDAVDAFVYRALLNVARDWCRANSWKWKRHERVLGANADWLQSDVLDPLTLMLENERRHEREHTLARTLKAVDDRLPPIYGQIIRLRLAGLREREDAVRSSLKRAVALMRDVVRTPGSSSPKRSHRIVEPS